MCLLDLILNSLDRKRKGEKGKGKGKGREERKDKRKRNITLLFPCQAADSKKAISPS